MLSGGTANITVDDAGNVSFGGSGLAFSLAQAQFFRDTISIGSEADWERWMPPASAAAAHTTPQEERVKRLRQYAGLANDAGNFLGPVLVTYFTANSEIPLAPLVAHVATTLSLGRAPDGSNVPILGPDPSVGIPVIAAGGATFLPLT